MGPAPVPCATPARARHRRGRQQSSALVFETCLSSYCDRIQPPLCNAGVSIESCERRRPMPPSSSTTGIAGHCTRAAIARAAAPTRADDLPPYIALEVVRRCSMLAQLAGTHSRSVIASFGLRGRGAVVPLPAIRSQKPAYGESTDAAGTIAFPRRLLRPELMGRQAAAP